LEAILKDIDAAIPVRVVARWIPAEIAAGVCDLDIFDVVTARPGAELYVHPLLHAKLYRFDQTAFFGSANLTAKALGWRAPTNVELLHAPGEMFDELRAFEKELLRSAIRVDAAYRDIVRAQVEKAKLEAVIATIEDADTHEVERTWLPICVAGAALARLYRRGSGAITYGRISL
jgi:phosphatidylserine/phosphatidylglycerophosphate/cardiolipin synthase-like enzyme